MKKASITDAKNNLSALIDGLKGGSPVLIVDRGRPVARLEPVTHGQQSDDDGRLQRLSYDRSDVRGPRHHRREAVESHSDERALHPVSYHAW